MGTSVFAQGEEYCFNSSLGIINGNAQGRLQVLLNSFNSSLGIINATPSCNIKHCYLFQFLIRYYKLRLRICPELVFLCFNSSLGIINEENGSRIITGKLVSIPH